MTIRLHRGDLPDLSRYQGAVAIDTETMGLNPHRDRLCLVQLSAGDGVSHLVQFAAGQYAAPRLRAMLTDPAVLKLFHFALTSQRAFLQLSHWIIGVFFFLSLFLRCVVSSFSFPLLLSIVPYE